MDRSKLPANVCVADDVKLGENVRLAPFVNLYGCEIGDDTRIGAFVEVQKRRQPSASAARFRATPSSARAW